MRSAAILGTILLVAAAAPLATGSFHEVTGKVPERVFPLVMSGTTFNGLHGDDRLFLEAFAGEHLRFEIAATESHTFHLHGHPWLILGDSRFVDVFLVDPDTPHGFEVDAGGADTHAGDWMFHCHIQDHMDEGMWGILRVYPFAARVLPGPVPIVQLDQRGAPIDGATLSLEVDGAPLAAHVEPLGQGRYAVHAPLPDEGALVVTAAHPALGTSVARVPLGGAQIPAPTILAAHHGAS